MANRLVLGEFNGEQALRISRPGYNVLSPGLWPEELSFDSRWTEIDWIFMHGYIAIPPGAPGVQLNFPVLPRPPIVLWQYRYDANSYVSRQHEWASGSVATVYTNNIYFAQCSGINCIGVDYMIMRNFYG